MAAYYFARLLDLELQKLFNSAEVNYDAIQNCIRLAELNFAQVNVEEFARALIKEDWSLDYIYLDRKHNLYDYKLERVEPVKPSSSDQ